MIYFFDKILRTQLGITSYLLRFLSAFCLAFFIFVFPASAQTNPDKSKEIKVAANNVKFDWKKGVFRRKKAALKAKKRRNRKSVRRKTKSRKASHKKTLQKKLKAQARRLKIRKARQLASRNRLLSKKLKLMRQKDVCGYPWVYAYKYKRCLCERRGFAQLGSRCIRLSKYCSGGSVWSGVKRKCICKTGFEYKNKQCVNVAVLDEDDEDDEEPPELNGNSCNAPSELASLSDKVGECPDGYKVINGKCSLVKEGKVTDAPAKTAAVTASATPDLAAPKVVGAMPATLITEPVYDLMKIRSCLHRAGFEGDGTGKAKYTGAMETYDAFRKFRQRHQLTHKVMDIYDFESQQILFGLCNGKQAQSVKSKAASVNPALQPVAVDVAEKTASPDDGGYIMPRPVNVTGATRPFASASPAVASSCLPSDLYDFLTTTYGTNERLKKCSKSCLPAPESMSEADKIAYGEKYDIQWCKSCLKVSSYMSLDEVMKVEKNAKVEVCTNPSTSLLFSKEEPRLIGRSYPKARGLYRDFPESASNVNTIAVLIGNKDYQKEYGINSNALNDVGAMFSFLSEHLGYSTDNIFDLRNATLAKMETVLGSAENGKAALWERLQRHPESRIMIYYSGHAMNNSANGKNYLLPVDAVKGREAHTAYSISLLLRNLRKLRASSIMLILETEFGRKTGNGILPPNAAELSVQLQSSVPVPGLTIFMASLGSQKALEDPDYGVGLFTRHFITGLAGAADQNPVGNGDGKIDVVELYVHTANMVRLSARKSFGLLQNPTLGQTNNMVISRLKVGN